MPASRTVSIVLPTYKEDGLDQALERLRAHVRGVPGHAFEILLVDDSPPEYQAKIRAYIDEHDGDGVDVRLLSGPGSGKGAAVRVGALASKGELVFTIDADLPVPLENIEVFLRALADGADAVIGERPFDRNLKNPARYVLSRALFLLQRGFIFHSDAFLDTQCGFKAFRGELIRDLASRQVVDGGMYDIEYLYAAVKQGKRVAREPVVSNPETRASKINVWKCIRTDPVDLLRVKWKGVRGGYR